MSINGDAWEEEVAQLKVRIAELELAAQPELLAPEDQPVGGPKLHTRACACRDCLRARIARAVAVLEDEALQPSARIRLALEALR